MKKQCIALIQNMNKVVDMVQMVGWPKDVSLDVDLDVVRKKSVLKKYFLAKAEPTSSFWDVGAKRVDGTSQHPASCTGLGIGVNEV